MRWLSSTPSVRSGLLPSSSDRISVCASIRTRLCGSPAAFHVPMMRPSRSSFISCSVCARQRSCRITPTSLSSLLKPNMRVGQLSSITTMSRQGRIGRKSSGTSFASKFRNSRFTDSPASIITRIRLMSSACWRSTTRVASILIWIRSAADHSSHCGTTNSSWGCRRRFPAPPAACATRSWLLPPAPGF